MVGIESMGIAPVRANNTEQAIGRPRQAASTTNTVVDGVEISAEAQQASQATRLANQASAQQQAIRQARIEEARRKIEEGTYKVQSVVQFVAARLTKYVAD